MSRLDSCKCSRCVSLCETTPGWFSPEEAESAMGAGMAERMMLEFYLEDDTVYALAPAARGREGRRALNTEELFGHDSLPFFDRAAPMPCSLLRGGRCEIHDSGYKPMECRAALGCGKDGMARSEMAALWRAPAAQALVRRWMKIVGMSEETLEECT